MAADLVRRAVATGSADRFGRPSRVGGEGARHVQRGAGGREVAERRVGLDGAAAGGAGAGGLMLTIATISSAERRAPKLMHAVVIDDPHRRHPSDVCWSFTCNLSLRLR